jgi:hypothetical protein
MPKYRVSEIVTLYYEVEAKDEKEAKELYEKKINNADQMLELVKDAFCGGTEIEVEEIE